MREALRRLSLPEKMLVVSGMAAVVSAGAAIDGFVGGERYQKKLTPEAVRQNPDVAPKEEMDQAQAILDQIDAQFYKNGGTGNLESRRDAILNIPDDPQTRKALQMLKEQRDIEANRNKFISENTPPRLAYQAIIGGLGALPISLSGMVISLGMIVFRETRKLERRLSANSSA